MYKKPRKISCPHCSGKHTKKYLPEHIKQVHSAPKLFKCELCDKVYKSKSSLKVHITIHRIGSASRIRCAKCSTSFSTNSSYVRHLERSNCHSINRKQFREACRDCGKLFKKKDFFVLHKCTVDQQRKNRTDVSLLSETEKDRLLMTNENSKKEKQSLLMTMERSSKKEEETLTVQKKFCDLTIQKLKNGLICLSTKICIDEKKRSFEMKCSYYNSTTCDFAVPPTKKDIQSTHIIKRVPEIIFEDLMSNEITIYDLIDVTGRLYVDAQVYDMYLRNMLPQNSLFRYISFFFGNHFYPKRMNSKKVQQQYQQDENFRDFGEKIVVSLRHNVHGAHMYLVLIKFNDNERKADVYYLDSLSSSWDGFPHKRCKNTHDREREMDAEKLIRSLTGIKNYEISNTVTNVPQQTLQSENGMECANFCVHYLRNLINLIANGCSLESAVNSIPPIIPSSLFLIRRNVFDYVLKKSKHAKSREIQSKLKELL